MKARARHLESPRVFRGKIHGRNTRIGWKFSFFYMNAKGELLRCERAVRWAAHKYEAEAEANVWCARARATGDPNPAAPEPPKEEEAPRCHTIEAFTDGVAFQALITGRRPTRSTGLPLTRATQVHYEMLLGHDILPRFGKRRLDEINEELVEEWMGDMMSEGKNCRGPVNFLKTILRFAVGKKALEKMPTFPKVAKPGVKATAPTIDDAGDYFSRATDWAKCAVGLAALCGLRSGELRALLVEDVNLKSGLIVVRRAYSEDELGVPKSKKERPIGIPEQLVPVLEEAIRDKLPMANVLTNARGEVPTRREIYNRFRHLGKFGPHMFRHYFLDSLADSEKVAVRTIQKLAGHSDLQTTQRYLTGRGRDVKEAAQHVPVLRVTK